VRQGATVQASIALECQHQSGGQSLHQGAEIDALIARRDAIVETFDRLIAQRGESRVLF